MEGIDVIKLEMLRELRKRRVPSKRKMKERKKHASTKKV
jgi:hypothetical protein